MFRMIIEIDWERMDRNGLNLESCKEEFDGFLSEVPEFVEEEENTYVTEDFGIMCYLMDLVEDCEWFMKYVSKWVWEDSQGINDVIDDYKKMGIKCCYE